MPGTAPRPGSPTGGVITPACFVPSDRFAVLVTIPATFLTELDFAIAFGILLGTTVVRSVLVTAPTLGPEPLKVVAGKLGHKPDPAPAELGKKRAAATIAGWPACLVAAVAGTLRAVQPGQAQSGLPDVSPGCVGPVALPATVGGSFVGGM